MEPISNLSCRSATEVPPCSPDLELPAMGDLVCQEREIVSPAIRKIDVVAEGDRTPATQDEYQSPGCSAESSGIISIDPNRSTIQALGQSAQRGLLLRTQPIVHGLTAPEILRSEPALRCDRKRS